MDNKQKEAMKDFFIHHPLRGYGLLAIAEYMNLKPKVAITILYELEKDGFIYEMPDGRFKTTKIPEEILCGRKGAHK